MSKDIKCKYCKYCKRYMGKYRTMASYHLNHPRCLFFCEHPEVNDFQKKLYPKVTKSADFLGYDDGFSYKLETLKTHLRWCPLANKSKEELMKNEN